MNYLIGVFIGVILVWITLLAIDFAEDRTIEMFNISGLLAAAGLIWIPILNRRKVNQELERREAQVNT